MAARPGRYRSRPAGGDDPDRPRHALRALGDRALGAGHDVRPGPLRLYGEDRDRSPRRRPAQPHEPLEDVVRKIAERKGGEPGDVTVIMLDRPRHEQAVETLREVGASIRFISDGDVAASLFAVDAEHRASTCSGGSAAPPRGCSRRRRSSAWAGESWAGSGRRDDDERKAAEDAGYEPRARARHRRPRLRRRRLLRRHRRHGRRPARPASAISTMATRRPSRW